MNLPISEAPQQQQPQPVQALRFDRDAGYHEPLHAHPDEGLLVYAESGAYTLFTEDCVWALLPTRAIWLPPGWPSGFEAGQRAPVRLRPLHFPMPLPADLPMQPKVIQVGELLAAVIRELRAITAAAPAQPADPGLVLALRYVALNEVLRATPASLLSLPRPSRPGLRHVTTAQLADLTVEWPLAACARAAHMSERTFSRLFPLEARGLTWPAWVRQARMMVGRQLLETGVPVGQVAAHVGYDSQSAFAAAYRRTFGHPPRQDAADSPARIGKS